MCSKSASAISTQTGPCQITGQRCQSGSLPMLGNRNAARRAHQASEYVLYTGDAQKSYFLKEVHKEVSYLLTQVG